MNETAKGLADLNCQEWKEAIGGMIFVFGCAVIFAYFAWLWLTDDRPR